MLAFMLIVSSAAPLILKLVFGSLHSSYGRVNWPMLFKCSSTREKKERSFFSPLHTISFPPSFRFAFTFYFHLVPLPPTSIIIRRYNSTATIAPSDNGDTICNIANGSLIHHQALQQQHDTCPSKRPSNPSALRTQRTSIRGPLFHTTA